MRSRWGIHPAQIGGVRIRCWASFHTPRPHGARLQSPSLVGVETLGCLSDATRRAIRNLHTVTLPSNLGKPIPPHHSRGCPALRLRGWATAYSLQCPSDSSGDKLLASVGRRAPPLSLDFPERERAISTLIRDHDEVAGDGSSRLPSHNGISRHHGDAGSAPLLGRLRRTRRGEEDQDAPGYGRRPPFDEVR
jgi:hypothetical protein